MGPPIPPNAHIGKTMGGSRCGAKAHIEVYLDYTVRATRHWRWSFVLITSWQASNIFTTDGTCDEGSEQNSRIDSVCSHQFTTGTLVKFRARVRPASYGTEPNSPASRTQLADDEGMGLALLRCSARLAPRLISCCSTR